MNVKILLLLIVIPLTYTIRYVLIGKYGNFWRWLIIWAHSLVLTSLLIFYANDPDYMLPDQFSLMRQTSQLTPSKQKTDAGLFINQNFWNIDISADVVTKDVIDPRTKRISTEVITDRKKLIQFLDIISRSAGDIDILVLDIDLGIQDSLDPDLYQRLKIFNDAKKLICAAPSIPRTGTPTFSDLNFAGIAEKSSDGIVSSYEIYGPRGFSLAYHLYARLQKIQVYPLLYGKAVLEKDSTGKSSLGLNRFIPKEYIDDETLVSSPGQEIDTIDFRDRQQFQVLYELTLKNLGRSFEEPETHQQFIDELKERKASGRKNIIIIGEFVAQRDTHETAYGKRNGTTMIINTMYSLMMQDHLLAIKDVIYLLLCITIVTWLTVYSNLRRQLPDEAIEGIMPEGINRKISFIIRYHQHFLNRNTITNKITAFCLVIAGLFLDQIHLILLVVLLFALTGSSFVNGVGIFLYFSVLSRLLSHFFKYAQDHHTRQS